MLPFEMTRLSSKGQVVLPQAVRRKLKIGAGDQFMVICEGEDVVLKRVEKPALDRFKQLLLEARKFVKKSGFKKSDVNQAIKKVRSSKQ